MGSVSTAGSGAGVAESLAGHARQWVFLLDSKVTIGTIGFNTKWSNDLDDLGLIWGRIPSSFRKPFSLGPGVQGDDSVFVAR